MATIKLQGGKVLLKDGKVSCSCCEPCCMYPADGLGDTYEAADLPATLYGKWADRADGTFTKSGDEYTLGTVTIRVNAGGTAWEFHDSDDDATSTIGNCLIRGDGNYTPEDDAVEDQFYPTYQVTLPNWGPGGSDLVKTVTREGLCQWYLFESLGDDGDGNEMYIYIILYYDVIDSPLYHWKLDGLWSYGLTGDVMISIGTKSDGSGQGSPVGAYSDFLGSTGSVAAAP